MTCDDIIGPGALDHLRDVIDRVGASSVFLVVGGGSYAACGAETIVDKQLKGLRLTKFSGVDENPRSDQLETALGQFRTSGADVILAIGGGSVIDMAKLIRIFSAQESASTDYVQIAKKLVPAKLPMVAVPTTAGSGSQATHFAVLYVGKTKFSIADDSMLPDVAIVDPTLLRSLPHAVFASTGLDALNQGIESYWSIHSTSQSKAFAQAAVSLVWENIINAIKTRTESSLKCMALGAHRAGQAINITKTTAPHSVSYPITSYYGVPHGHAVGLVMSRFIKFNFEVSNEDCLDPRGAEYVRNTVLELMSLLGQPDVFSGAQAYDRLMDELGLERNFERVGLRSVRDLEKIIIHGFNPERVNNNPRQLTESQLRELLREAPIS